MKKIILMIAAAVCIFAGCQNQRVQSDNTEQTKVSEKIEQETEETAPINIIQSDGGTIETRFSVPEGYERIACEDGTFGDFLREYPLLPDGENVHLYDGSLKGNQNDHVAVFDMELAEGDLQQCADSVLRLYAEYLYGTKQYSLMNFKLTNGFVLSFDKWRAGLRVSVNDNETKWVASAESSDSEDVFKRYLQFLFTYAGTLSMGSECSQADISDIQPGDVFLYSGSPGHVVMVLDVCENESGERAFLLGQGYMPAQQFHVLKNPAHEDDPWYYVDEVSYPFYTPEYTFDEGSFMRPVYLQ